MFGLQTYKLPRLLTTTCLLLFLAACTDDTPIEDPVSYSNKANTATPGYRLAIHPLHNPRLLLRTYQPLIEHINSQLENAHLELEASRDYQAYEEKIFNAEPDFLLPNPWQTLQAFQAGYRVIAMAGDAEDFKGLIIARKASNIKNTSQLVGKTISYPSPTALAACIMPQYFLHKMGLNINKEVDNVYVGSQESSIMHVYLNQATVGATWPPPWRLFQKNHPEEASELEVVWETPHLLNNSVMARQDIPDHVIRQVRNILLAMPRNASEVLLLESMETAGFFPADNDTYQHIADFAEIFEKEVRPIETPGT